MLMPRLSASATAAMVGEGAQISASDLTLAQLTLTAKKLGALVQASNEVMADASGNLRQFVDMDLLKTMSAKLDYELLEGTGAGAEL